MAVTTAAPPAATTRAPSAPSTRHRARDLATVLVLALLALLLSPLATGPSAQALEHPTLLPVPQEVTWDGAAVDLSGGVLIESTDPTADPAVVDALTQAVTAAGGTVVADAQAATARIVTGTGDAAAVHLPDGLTLPSRAEGYALTTAPSAVPDTGDLPTVAAVGTDADGTFYAAQTLRQLVTDGAVPGVTVRDWPLMSVRGAVEGFYGAPWSRQARLDLLDHMARHKLNTLIYAPKGDPYLRERWREPYPAAELAGLSELVEAARTQHIDLVVALSPGQDVCYYSQEDHAATIATLDQLRQAGVTHLAIALDDTPEALACESDRAQASGEDETVDLVSAQSHYLNRVQREYLRAHGLPDLTVVPTEYTGTEATTAKTTQAATLDPDVQVMWTGPGIVTETLTADGAAEAAEAYGTEELLVWDNYPANDGGNADRLFLAPPEGRDPGLSEQVTGITSNPMVQAYASWPALAGYGSLTWNGPAWETMLAFVDLNRSWRYDPAMAASPGLAADVAAFRTAVDGGDLTEVDEAAAVLSARLQLLVDAPQTLSGISSRGFYDGVLPWLEAASDWARAGLAAVEVRRALAHGDAPAATAALLEMHEARAAALGTRIDVLDEAAATPTVVEDAVVPSLGDGLLEGLVGYATAAWSQWAALEEPALTRVEPAGATSEVGPEEDEEDRRPEPADAVADGDPTTAWTSAEPPEAGQSLTVDLGGLHAVARVSVDQGQVTAPGREPSGEGEGGGLGQVRVETSTDGELWVSAGTACGTGPLAVDLPTPVDARYVRLTVVEPPVSARPVSVNEVTVLEPAAGAPGRPPSVPLSVLDGDGATRVVGGDALTGGPLERAVETAAAGPVDVVVAGRVDGTLEVRTPDGTWRPLGEVSAASAWTALRTEGPITGIRLTGVTSEPVLVELGYRLTTAPERLSGPDTFPGSGAQESSAPADRPDDGPPARVTATVVWIALAALALLVAIGRRRPHPR